MVDISSFVCSYHELLYFLVVSSGGAVVEMVVKEVCGPKDFCYFILNSW